MPSALGSPDVFRADRADRVVREQARPRAGGEVVELRRGDGALRPSCRGACRRSRKRGSRSCWMSRVTRRCAPAWSDDVDLPVGVRHQLIRDELAVGRERRRVDALRPVRSVFGASAGRERGLQRRRRRRSRSSHASVLPSADIVTPMPVHDARGLRGEVDDAELRRASAATTPAAARRTGSVPGRRRLRRPLRRRPPPAPPPPRPAPPPAPRPPPAPAPPPTVERPERRRTGDGVDEARAVGSTWTFDLVSRLIGEANRCAAAVGREVDVSDGRGPARHAPTKSTPRRRPRRAARI